MKTLILYAGKYGATADCAQRLCALLGDAQARDLAREPRPELAGYDAVILGASVYMGRPRKEMVAYAREAQPLLLQRRLGLFLCCIQDISRAVSQQFASAYPRALREHACAQEALGGRVEYRKLGRLDGWVMQLIAGDLRKRTGSDVLDTISQERIERFAAQMRQG